MERVFLTSVGPRTLKEGGAIDTPETDERIVLAMSADELETVSQGLRIGARLKKETGDKIVRDAEEASTYAHKREQAQRQAMPEFQESAAMTELAEEFETLQ